LLRPSLPPPDFGVAISIPKWSADDPRRSLGLTVRDNRVPFALTQCTTSSPRILIYHPDKVDEQLDQAVKEFFAHNVFLATPKLGYLSKYCAWWAKDYGKKKELMDTLGQFAQLPSLSDIDIKYNEFDWEYRLYLDHLASEMPITHRLARISTSKSALSELSGLPPQPKGAAPKPPKHTKPSKPPLIVDVSLDDTSSKDSESAPTTPASKHHHHHHHTKHEHERCRSQDCKKDPKEKESKEKDSKEKDSKEKESKEKDSKEPVTPRQGKESKI